MAKKKGFDNELYLQGQSRAILDRINMFGDKLYLEFGGKLLFDLHAARVLPGFDPNVKMRLLQKLKDQADILLCIYAGDIERKKVRLSAWRIWLQKKPRNRTGGMKASSAVQP